MLTNKSTDISELSEQVLRGINKALQKLIETNAANDQDMVIGDKEGNVKIVPAKELLKGLSK